MIKLIVHPKGEQPAGATAPVLPGCFSLGFFLTMQAFKNNIHYCRSIEVATLGICLLEPAAIFKIRDTLTVEMLYYPEAQVVYQGLLEMADQAIPIDLITAHVYFCKHKQIPHVKTDQVAWFLSKLTNEVVSSAHLVRWSIILKSMWRERELMRLKPETVAELQEATNKLSNRVSKNPKIKAYRFFLTYVEKSLLKPTITKYGARIIGKSHHRIKVSSPLLVYLMSITEPQYTWTCGDVFNEELTNDQCKNRLPKDSILTPSGWICKINKFPVTWR